MEQNQILNIIEVLLLLPFIYELNQFLLKRMDRKFSFFSIKKMNWLFIYHILFGGIYYIYALYNPSDSKRYFSVPQKSGKSWLDFLGTETTFIDFISYPFINGLGFSYEMMMLLFTWIGYWGFVFGFLFFKENIPQKIRVFKGIDLLTLILFFPNMHFWSASLGKGAPIFFAIMLFAFSISKFKTRRLALIISSVLIFAIRPHMFLLICIGIIYGLYFGKNSIPKRYKLGVGLAITTTLLVLHKQILGVVGLENSNNLIADFIEFSSKRSESLNDASSGLQMAGYSIPEKIFTFWFRPLFLDAPGLLGVIVSVENLIYLLLFGKLLRINFLRFWKNAPSNVKTSMMIFVSTSFAMTFIMSNLGIMIRQKTMIMYFMFFVIYHFLAYEKSEKLKLNWDKNVRSYSA